MHQDRVDCSVSGFFAGPQHFDFMYDLIKLLFHLTVSRNPIGFTFRRAVVGFVNKPGEQRVGRDTSQSANFESRPQFLSEIGQNRIVDLQPANGKGDQLEKLHDQVCPTSKMSHAHSRRAACFIPLRIL
jgi:hypothetical protein